ETAANCPKLPTLFSDDFLRPYKSASYETSKKEVFWQGKTRRSCFPPNGYRFPGQPSATQITRKCSGNGFGCEQFTAI
ncbi:hypothetical protein, partial [Pseudomonas aeruginosa]|uniref:hypothetical protein n=1 Tax=Pseudomonas aeruginosa TaxID=287 RepID=UPI00374A2362